MISPTVWFEGSALSYVYPLIVFPEGGFPLTPQTATLALLTDSFKIEKKHKIGIMINLSSHYQIVLFAIFPL